MDLVLIRLVDIGFIEMLPDPYCRYIETACGFGFNQIGGHRFHRDVTRSLL